MYHQYPYPGAGAVGMGTLGSAGLAGFYTTSGSRQQQVTYPHVRQQVAHVPRLGSSIPAISPSMLPVQPRPAVVLRGPRARARLYDRLVEVEHMKSGRIVSTIQVDIQQFHSIGDFIAEVFQRLAEEVGLEEPLQREHGTLEYEDVPGEWVTITSTTNLQTDLATSIRVRWTTLSGPLIDRGAGSVSSERKSHLKSALQGKSRAFVRVRKGTIGQVRQTALGKDDDFEWHDEVPDAQQLENPNDATPGYM